MECGGNWGRAERLLEGKGKLHSVRVTGATTTGVWCRPAEPYDTIVLYSYMAVMI